MPPPTQNKNLFLYLATKIKILDCLAKGQDASAVARQFDLNEDRVTRIKKCEDAIRHSYKIELAQTSVRGVRKAIEIDKNSNDSMPDLGLKTHADRGGEESMAVVSHKKQSDNNVKDKIMPVVGRKEHSDDDRGDSKKLSESDEEKKSKTKMKRKRTSIHLDTKIEVLDSLASGECASVVAMVYGLNEASVRTIKVNEDAIRASYSKIQTSSKTSSLPKPKDVVPAKDSHQYMEGEPIPKLIRAQPTSSSLSQSKAIKNIDNNKKEGRKLRELRPKEHGDVDEQKKSNVELKMKRTESIINLDTKIQILDSLASGKRSSELAMLFGVDEVSIRTIKQNETAIRFSYLHTKPSTKTTSCLNRIQIASTKPPNPKDVVLVPAKDSETLKKVQPTSSSSSQSEAIRNIDNNKNDTIIPVLGSINETALIFSYSDTMASTETTSCSNRILIASAELPKPKYVVLFPAKDRDKYVKEQPVPKLIWNLPSSRTSSQSKAIQNIANDKKNTTMPVLGPKQQNDDGEKKKSNLITGPTNNLDKKIQILDWLASGKCVSDVAMLYGLDEVSVRTIKKNEAAIRATYSNIEPSTKTTPSSNKMKIASDKPPNPRDVVLVPAKDSEKPKTAQPSSSSSSQSKVIQNIENDKKVDTTMPEVGHNDEEKKSNQISKKRKLTGSIINLKSKIKILDWIESGKCPSAVAWLFGLNEATVRTIKNNEVAIRNAYKFRTTQSSTNKSIKSKTIMDISDSDGEESMAVLSPQEHSDSDENGSITVISSNEHSGNDEEKKSNQKSETIYLNTELQVVNCLASGQRPSAVDKLFGLNETTVTAIKRNEDKIRTLHNFGSIDNYKAKSIPEIGPKAHTDSIAVLSSKEHSVNDILDTAPVLGPKEHSGNDKDKSITVLGSKAQRGDDEETIFILKSEMNEILYRLASGQHPSDVGKHFNLNEAAVRSIKMNEAAIRNSYNFKKTQSNMSLRPRTIKTGMYQLSNPIDSDIDEENRDFSDSGDEVKIGDLTSSDDSYYDREQNPNRKFKTTSSNSLDTKPKKIDRLAAGQGSTSVAKHFGLNEATIQPIKKNATAINNSVSSGAKLSAAVHIRDHVEEKTEKVLASWIERNFKQGMAIHENYIRQLALRIYKKIQAMQPSTSTSSSLAQPNKSVGFAASTEWMRGFLKRKGLSNRIFASETAEGLNENILKANLDKFTENALGTIEAESSEVEEEEQEPILSADLIKKAIKLVSLLSNYIMKHDRNKERAQKFRHDLILLMAPYIKIILKNK